MDVSVVIVNYNTADIIENCINSVLTQKNINFEIIVVDNNSQDNSIEKLEKMGNKIKLIKNTNNLGFGKANNQGFELSTGKYIFLLNPDAVLNQADDLKKLIDYMENNKNYGVIGPCVMKDHQITQPQMSYPGQKYLTKTFEKLVGGIAWIIGACMLIRCEVYKTINGFDEDYFLYGEEADFCLRVRRAGWLIGTVPEIVIHHMGGASERKTSIRDYWLKKQAGTILFYKKSYGLAEALNLIDREIKQAKKRLFILKFIKNADKQARYEAVLEISQKEKLLCRSLLS